jgi:hypothetical protein
VKGGSRAEFLIKTDRPMKRLVLTLSAGAVDTEVDATVAGRTQHVGLSAGASQQVFFELGEGFPYQGQWPVWKASVSSSAGFVPALTEVHGTTTLTLRGSPLNATEAEKKRYAAMKPSMSGGFNATYNHLEQYLAQG